MEYNFGVQRKYLTQKELKSYKIYYFNDYSIFITNLTLHNGIYTRPIKKEAHIVYIRFHKRLQTYPNPFIKDHSKDLHSQDIFSAQIKGVVTTF